MWEKHGSGSDSVVGIPLVEKYTKKTEPDFSLGYFFYLFFSAKEELKWTVKNNLGGEEKVMLKMMSIFLNNIP